MLNNNENVAFDQQDLWNAPNSDAKRAGQQIPHVHNLKIGQLSG